MNIKDIVNKIGALKAQRAELAKQDRDIGALLKTAEAELIDALSNEGVDRVTVDGTNYRLVNEPIPTVVDWDALYADIIEHKWLFLLHKRLTTTAAAELIEAGVTIKGVDVVAHPAIRYSKA